MISKMEKKDKNFIIYLKNLIKFQKKLSIWKEI